MGKRIVIALGGNALGKNLPEQMLAVKETSKAIADLVEAGHTVAVAHGNGPQVGMIQNAFAAYCRQEPSADVMPLSMCVAMSQGYIGYDLQNALKEELLNRGLQQGVATVLTQVVVEGDDPAFQHPTKPIGAFMSKEEAEKMAREKGWHIAEDAPGETAPGQAELSGHPHCRQRRVGRPAAHAQRSHRPPEPRRPAGRHHLPFSGGPHCEAGLSGCRQRLHLSAGISGVRVREKAQSAAGDPEAHRFGSWKKTAGPAAPSCGW